MIYQHTARVIPEKQTSHLPAAVLLCGVSKGIDMTTQREFLVAEDSYVRINSDGFIDMDFAPFHATVDGKLIFEVTEQDVTKVDVVSIANLSPEQAYLMGKALLMAAKLQGVG